MKTVIVTGAAGNLGRAVVNKFIAEGCRVTGTVFPGDTSSFDFPAGHFERVELDLGNENDSLSFVNGLITRFGVIDSAVLTVGAFASGKIPETSAADICKQYRQNFESAYHIARPVFTQMLKQKYGRIFLIGSRPGLSAADGRGMVAYGLAKSLLVRLAELMNDEARGMNVNAAVVVPSTIDTPQNREALPDAPFTDWVKAEDIAHAIYYHSSDEAKALRQSLIKVYNNA